MDKYVYQTHGRWWRFEITCNFRTVKHSYSKVFNTKPEAVEYRDKWLAETHWTELAPAARAKILINGGAKPLEELDNPPKRTNIQNTMDNSYIYDQFKRQEEQWANCHRRVMHLEAQLSALVERIYNIEQEIDAINARRDARARAAAKKQQQNA